MKIYIAICSDRHSDIDAYPYLRQEDAENHCREFGNFKTVTLTPSMKNKGWVFYGDLSPEGDYVLVLERNMVIA